MEFLTRYFDAIFGPDLHALGCWRGPTHEQTVRRVTHAARRYFDHISDEMIDPEQLAAAAAPFLAALGHFYQRYGQLLLDANSCDFGRLQVLAERVLRDDRVAEAVGGDMHHLMVDEYQDTSFVQEQIILRLAQPHRNLVVVGDEDQAIFGFRGASSANLLEFPQHFPDGRIEKLTVNYRSHKHIVNGFDRWMKTADWSNPDPQGPPLRFEKTIVPRQAGKQSVYPGIITVYGDDPTDEARQVAELVQLLALEGRIRRYGEAAMLLHSVQDRVAGRYLQAFSNAGIPVDRHSRGGARQEHSRDPRGNVVTVTTIHGAKGLEWPVVIVGSLSSNAREADPIGRTLRSYTHRSSLASVGQLDHLNRMHQFYVAFSRPQRLLVLTANRRHPPHDCFRQIWDPAPRWNDTTRTGLCRALPSPPQPAAKPVEPQYFDRFENLVLRMHPTVAY